MISEVERYQGIVLRQLLVACGRAVRLGVVAGAGRVDAYSFQNAAFQVKHSSKRLSPWQFTYLPENLAELDRLCGQFSPVWVMLVCGLDGVVGLSYDELLSVIGDRRPGGVAVRVSRSRRALYRVRGPLGFLARAKAKGVESFLGATIQGWQEGGRE